MWSSCNKVGMSLSSWAYMTSRQRRRNMEIMVNILTALLAGIVGLSIVIGLSVIVLVIAQIVKAIRKGLRK